MAFSFAYQKLSLIFFLQIICSSLCILLDVFMLYTTKSLIGVTLIQIPYRNILKAHIYPTDLNLVLNSSPTDFRLNGHHFQSTTFFLGVKNAFLTKNHTFWEFLKISVSSLRYQPLHGKKLFRDKI